MKSFFKWSCIIIGGIVVLFVLTLILAPMFLDIQTFKPRIERTVQEATGRPFVLGGKLELSLFPWAGITLTDVSLGNPKGFGEKPFAAFSEFEVRMKLLPLLAKDVQVSRFILKGLRLDLVRKKDGRVNWDFSKTGETERKNTAEEAAGGAGDTFPIKALAVGEISISDGTIRFVDEQSDMRKTVSDVNAQLEDVSFDKPIRMQFSARLDDKPFSLKGSIGPLGDSPGKGRIDVDLTAGAFDVAELAINGQVTDAMSAPAYQINLTSNTFSLKRLIKQIAPDMVVSPSDSSVLERVSFQARVSGDTKQVSLSDGKLMLDDTTTTFQVNVKDVSKPDIDWKVHMDKIDLDRYLPKSEPAKDEPSTAGGSGNPAKPAEKAKTDYAPLRAVVVNGNLSIEELKAGGGTVREIVMKMDGARGKFIIEPLSMKLYQGSIVVTGDADVTGDVPKTRMNVTVDNVQAEPLLKDFIQKDFLTGTANARISLSMSGDEPDGMKRTLDGQGDIRFTDGAVRGVNILGMVHNLQAAFGLADAAKTSGTEFSEFTCPFTIKQGIFETTDTKLASPVMRMAVSGNADLVKETLDFRIVPTWVNPIDKKAGGQDISGTVAPVLVTGTFSSPKFRPDVTAAAKKAVEKALTDFLGGSSEKPKDGASDKQGPVEDTVKGLLKKLPFGN